MFIKPKPVRKPKRKSKIYPQSKKKPEINRQPNPLLILLLLPPLLLLPLVPDCLFFFFFGFAPSLPSSSTSFFFIVFLVFFSSPFLCQFILFFIFSSLFCFSSSFFGCKSQIWMKNVLDGVIWVNCKVQGGVIKKLKVQEAFCKMTQSTGVSYIFSL